MPKDKNGSIDVEGTVPHDNDRPDESGSERVGTARLSQIADICLQASQDLARQGYRPNGQKVLRRFSSAEAARYMLRMPQPALRSLLQQNPALPQGPDFDLEAINTIRDHLGILPRKPADRPARVVTVCNFKGGVAKTTTAAHLAMAAALDGYRVLVVDLDSQASISTLFGVLAATERETSYAALARHCARHARVTSAAGDAELTDYLDLGADDLIRPTHWPTIDILPAQLDLYWAEFQVPVWLKSFPGWQFWDALNSFLADEHLLRDYDLILVDTPPALGYLTINGLSAADVVLVPVGASYIEFDSTGRFFDMLHTTFASIEEALGPAVQPFNWDAVRVLLTRYDATQQADMAGMIDAYLGDVVAAERLAFTALVGQAGEQVSGLYEVAPGDFNRDTYLRGRAAFDAVWAEIRALVEAGWSRWEDAV
ncbi:MAG: AAA family ATPase [Pseudomonadota bacterium]